MISVLSDVQSSLNRTRQRKFHLDLFIVLDNFHSKKTYLKKHIMTHIHIYIFKMSNSISIQFRVIQTNFELNRFFFDTDVSLCHTQIYFN